jgi:hypothetical protein
MADPTSFFFANAKPGEPLSYGALQTRRKIAEQLMGKRSPFPKTFGEGLTYLGESIGDVMQMNRLDAAEKAREVGLTDIERNAPPSGAAAGSVENTAVAPAASPATSASVPPAASSSTYPPPAAAPGNIPLPPPRPARLRDTQLSELQADPALMRRAAAMTLGEVDRGTSPAEQQTQFATALDRAQARGIPVLQALETYTGPGSRGYYPPDAFARGERALQKPGALEAFERDIATPVLRGADPGAAALGFTPTGNASGGVAQRGVASGRYNVAGRFPGSAETYVQQESPAQLARLEAGRNRIAAAAMPDETASALAYAAPSQAPSSVQTAALTTPGVANDAGPASAALPAQTPLDPANNAPIPSAIPLAPPEVRAPGVQTAQASGAAIPALPANMPPGYEMAKPVPPDVPKERPKNERELYGERILAQGIRRGDPQMQAIGQDFINKEKAVRDHLYARDVEAYKNQYTHFSALDKLWQETQIAKQGKTLSTNKAAQELTVLPRQLQQGLTKEDIANQAAALKLKQETPPEAPAVPPPGTPHPDLGTPNSPQRTGIPTIGPVPPGVTPHEWGQKQAPELVKAVSAYEKAVPQFNEAIQTLKLAREHPGIETGTGFFSEVAKRIPGSSAYGFGKIMEQIVGKNFLAAYQQLKGGGSITEIEGTKAEAAQARLATAQSRGDFDKALNDLEIALRSDLEQTQRKVNAPVTAWQRTNNDPYAPDKGERRGNQEYIGGNPAAQSSWRTIL